MYKERAMRELKELLMSSFPGWINKVILFGSRARGDSEDSSDYDIVVILKKEFDWKFKNEVLDKTWEIDFKYDILTDIRLISNSDMQTIKGKQPFILDALEAGIEI